MWKPITKKAHGAIDYAYVAIVPLLPQLAGFKKVKKANILCQALGAGALGYTVITKARWGLIRILPFKSHLIVDFSVSCLALATPWLLGFSRNTAARNCLLAVGVSGLAASVLTEPADKEDLQHQYLFI